MLGRMDVGSHDLRRGDPRRIPARSAAAAMDPDDEERRRWPADADAGIYGMAYIVMAYIVMAYIVMADIVMAYVVMAYLVQLWQHGFGTRL